MIASQRAPRIGRRTYTPGIGIALLAAVLFGSTVSAQDIRISGGFLSDSLKIGERTAYYLSARYPSDLTVLFPDSTLSFFPFEYQGKKYFPTETNADLSVDSAVYYLTTFEVDRVQHLELPVFTVHAEDCTVTVSPRDSILITQLVASVPDSIPVANLPLKMNTTYQRVSFQFNFWMMMIIIGLVALVCIVAWIFFGKRIIQYFKARKLERNHSRFVSVYNDFLGQLQSTFSSPTTESALSAWKKYMEQLESRPYTKLTTRETLALVHDEKLGSVLSTVDRAIYGHDTQVVESLESLRHFADRRFSEKLKEVKHGK